MFWFDLFKFTNHQFKGDSSVQLNVRSTLHSCLENIPICFLSFFFQNRVDAARSGDKYETSSTNIGYSKYMKLKIRSVGPNDYGFFRCVAKNSLGETDGLIKLEGKLFDTKLSNTTTKET